jgi:hypothetical protein
MVEEHGARITSTQKAPVRGIDQVLVLAAKHGGA